MSTVYSQRHKPAAERFRQDLPDHVRQRIIAVLGNLYDGTNGEILEEMERKLHAQYGALGSYSMKADFHGAALPLYFFQECPVEFVHISSIEWTTSHRSDYGRNGSRPNCLPTNNPAVL